MRIVYQISRTDKFTGGPKTALKHVEALRELGIDAAVRISEGAFIPEWMKCGVPIINGGHLPYSDIIVVPEDDGRYLKELAMSPHHKVIFCQNHFFAADGVGLLEPAELANYVDYMACGYETALWLAKFIPHQSIEVVPAFFDERYFKPKEKRRAIACTPRKRPNEYRWIRYMFSRLHSESKQWPWAVLETATVQQVADAFGSAAVFLSLSRFEGLGLASLEALASGCVVAGFTGLGGREYANPTNGFWVDEDDCEACARALVQAVRLAERGGCGLKLMQAASIETAARWSRQRFVSALQRFWLPRIERWEEPNTRLASWTAPRFDRTGSVAR